MRNNYTVNATQATITRADGRQIMRESRGAFPDMTPEPEATEEVEND